MTGMQDNEKKKATDWEKIFAKYLSDVTQNMQRTLTTQQENNLIKTWTK